MNYSITRTSTWKASGQYFSFKGHQIFFKSAGVGEALILIHGFPTSSWDWFKIWDTLARQYRVAAPDLIGFGFSDKPEDFKYTIKDQADLVDRLIAHLHLKEVAILAHDYGNTVTQELLARQLDGTASYKINSILLLNGGLFPESHRPRLIQKMLLSPIGKWISPLLNKEKLAKNFNAIFGPETPPSASEINQFWELIAYQQGQKNFHKLIRYITERRTFRARWVGALQNSPIPIRFVNGPEDPISGIHMAERYRAIIPNPDVVFLDNIGHYPQIEAPELVSKQALDFFQSKMPTT